MMLRSLFLFLSCLVLWVQSRLERRCGNYIDLICTYVGQTYNSLPASFISICHILGCPLCLYVCSCHVVRRDRVEVIQLVVGGVLGGWSLV